MKIKYDESLLFLCDEPPVAEETMAQRRARISKIKGKEAQGMAWYDAWMRSRSAGKDAHHLDLQKQEIHEIAFISNDRVVCTCSLITGLRETCDDEDLWNYPGHINTITREPVEFFVVNFYLGRSDKTQERYWCQSCGDCGPAKLTESSRVSLVTLRKNRQSHKCLNFSNLD